MGEGDLEEAVLLISLSMNKDEAKWARETMKLYFRFDASEAYVQT